MEANEELYFYQEIKVLEKRKAEIVDILNTMKTGGAKKSTDEQDELIRRAKVTEKAIHILKHFRDEH